MEIFTIDRKEGDFITIYKEAFRNKALSLKARGLLATLMALGPRWQFSVNGIASILKERRDAIYSTIKELQEAGYCHRYDLMDENNRFAGTHYAFSEYRREWPEKYDGPRPDFPNTENPYTENPDTGKPTQYNNETNIKQNGYNKENNKARARFVKPTIEEVQAYCRERGNDIDPAEFVDFYASKGWMVGSSPMKDWKACVRTWERSHAKARPSGSPSSPFSSQQKRGPKTMSEIYADLYREINGTNPTNYGTGIDEQ